MSNVDEVERENRLLQLQLELADEALDIVLEKYEDLMSGIEVTVNLFAIGNLTAQEALDAILLKVAAAKQERDYHSKGYLGEFTAGVRSG